MGEESVHCGGGVDIGIFGVAMERWNGVEGVAGNAGVLVWTGGVPIRARIGNGLVRIATAVDRRRKLVVLGKAVWRGLGGVIDVVAGGARRGMKDIVHLNDEGGGVFRHGRLTGGHGKPAACGDGAA